MCAYHCALLEYTIMHRTVLTIFPLNLQTITIAQMLSTEGEGGISIITLFSNGNFSFIYHY